MTVRIEQPGEIGSRARIMVDGVDISRFVTSIDVRLDAFEMPSAVVTLLPVEMCIDLPDDAVRLVHADDAQ